LYFINKDTGWVSGALAYNYKTTNGGITFDSTSIVATYTMDIYFKDSNTGFMTSEGRVLKTTNGGSTWFVSLDVLDTRIFWKISVVDNQFAWVSGMNGYGVFRTNNLGNNWSLVNDSSYMIGMFGVCFINKDTGFVGGNINKLFKTTDGGYHWARENTQTNNETFESIEFVNDAVGWVCSTTGVILHTTTGGQTLVTVNNISTETPSKYSLSQNYPNPFNPTTKIRFDVANGFPIKTFGNDKVVLKVYDVMGREVQTLVNESLKPGTYEVSFDGSALTSGVYFYKLIIRHGGSSTGGFTETKKMLMIK